MERLSDPASSYARNGPVFIHFV